MLNLIVDRLNTTNELELRSITGFLRNLSRHCKDKNSMGEYGACLIKCGCCKDAEVQCFGFIKSNFAICFISASKVVKHLVVKLPEDGSQNGIASDVVVNICGALNNLVSCSEVAARDIAFFDGLPKLVCIKNSTDKK